MTLLVAIALSGCGADAERQAAGDVALRFARVAQTDPATACGLLSAETRRQVELSEGMDCPGALEEADLPESTTVTGVTVAGQNAQAVLDGDTIFLSLFTDGWHVVGAGCAREFTDPAKPYDCEISKG